MSCFRIGTAARATFTMLMALWFLTAGGCDRSASREVDDTATPGAPEADAATGEQLRLVPPATWTLANASKRDNFARAQYVRPVPEADRENVDAAAATETLTLEQLDPQGLSDPLVFLENLAAEQAQRCDDFDSIVISSGFENGHPSAVRLLRCPRRRVNNSASVSMAKAIAGNDRYYLLVFEKRTAADGSEPLAQVTESDIATWSLYLRQATLCDSRSSEHPCPTSGPSSSPVGQTVP